ncbi:Meckel syndrome type 1 protein isoform X2 [Chelonus insularis]|nr:Meckel syndrome type 1 protein-like isoform X2 [Chelonus insularis]
MIFEWQKKVFSSFEIDHFKDERNCINKTHEAYHEEILNKNLEGSRLYSYIHKDLFNYEKNPVTKEGFKSFLSVKNEIAIPAILNKKPFHQRYNKKVIDSVPNDSQIRSNHYLYKDRRVMHLMVDLSSKDQTFKDPEVSEILLCRLTFDKAGKILTVDPDFNSDECYTIEEAGMIYDYWIEHASRPPTEEEMQRQEDLLRREAQESILNRELKIYSDMKMPPPNILRLYLTLDFTEARGFPYDAVFLTYSIDLPKNWNTNRHDSLSGRTQRSRMVNGYAHLSHTVEISLDFDLNCLNDENVQLSWPYLLISVASLDKWTRYRIEGYASVQLPPRPGSYEFHLQTWRPITGFINSLRRFFTGGAAELEDIKYCGIPRDHQGLVLDKTELNVVSGGIIDLRMNIVQQSRKFAPKLRRNKHTRNKINHEELLRNVENVVEQYKAARERMIQIRSTSTPQE